MFKTTTAAIQFIRLAGWLFSILVVWLFWFGVAGAAQIASFVSDVVVQADSSLLITETITYDFGSEQKHGIFRKISDQHAQEASVWYKERYVDLELISVTRDGLVEPYTIEKSDGFVVKIGDPERTISGAHVYEINYRAKGAVADYPEEVEVYWNVTGDEWPVDILSLEARVRAAAGVSLIKGTYGCYVGFPGATNKKCLIATASDTETTFVANQVLVSGVEMTVAQRISLSQPPLVLERHNSVLLWLLALLAGLVSFSVWVYGWRTKYKISQPIISQYEPYADFKPMFTGVLFDNKLDSRDISAGIVYLAQEGFISIKEIKSKVLFLFNYTDYEVTKLRHAKEIDTKFGGRLLRLLFDNSAEVGFVVKLSAIKKDRSKLLQTYQVIQSMRKAVTEDLAKSAFIEDYSARANKVMIVVYLGGVTLALLSKVKYIADSAWFGLSVLVLVVMLVSTLIVSLFTTKRRTRKGYEAENYLKGFRRFLKVTETERYKFHNAPALSPQQFMEHLPYAIAFGVEKEWAGVFKDIQIDAPDWYSSTSGTAFNAGAFTTNLSAFSTSFSSSTGSSGSSGGGSAGGGSGGGGGGSW